MIRLVDSCSNRYVFLCSEYPRKRHRLPWASNFERFSIGSCTYAWQPNTLTFASIGFFFIYSSRDVLSKPWARVSRRLRRKTAVIIASPQYFLANPAYSIMQRAHSTRVRFILSTTPSSAGVYGNVKIWTMPRSAQNLAVLADLYSPLLPLRGILTELPTKFSANFTKWTNLLKTSDLFRMRYTAQCQDLSSMKVTKYFYRRKWKSSSVHTHRCEQLTKEILSDPLPQTGTRHEFAFPAHSLCKAPTAWLIQCQHHLQNRFWL